MALIRKIGAMVYCVKEKKIYFLILHRVLRWKGWETLKGTIRKNESLEKSLRREIKEELNLKEYKIVKRLGKSISWRWGKNKVKIIDFFLVKTNISEKIDLEQKVIEHDRYKWVSKREALKLITHENVKEIFRGIKDIE